MYLPRQYVITIPLSNRYTDWNILSNSTYIKNWVTNNLYSFFYSFFLKVLLLNFSESFSYSFFGKFYLFIFLKVLLINFLFRNFRTHLFFQAEQIDIRKKLVQFGTCTYTRKPGFKSLRGFKTFHFRPIIFGGLGCS